MDPKAWWRWIKRILWGVVFAGLIGWGLKYTAENPGLAVPGQKGGLDWGIVTDNPIFPKRWQ